MPLSNSDSIETAGDRKESSDGSVMFPAEGGDSDKKARLSDLLKRHPSQDPGLSSLRNEKSQLTQIRRLNLDLQSR